MTDQQKEQLNKLQLTMKVFSEYELPDAMYKNIVLFKLNVLLKLMNSLSANKVQIDAWKVWCEAVVYKFAYHSASMIKLYEGTDIPYKVEDDRDLKIFDEPTIITIFRVILENYLMFFYLFIDDVTDAEKQFRIDVWRYCGLKQRDGFKMEDANSINKQIKERPIMEGLKQSISSNSLFLTYSSKQQKQFLKGTDARLGISWKDLIQKSNLIKDTFDNLYGHRSSYTHSEFISIMQIQQSNYVFSGQRQHQDTTLFMTHALISKMIIELCSFFPTMKIEFEKLEENLKAEIEILATTCTNTNLNRTT